MANEAEEHRRSMNALLKTIAVKDSSQQQPNQEVDIIPSG